MAVVRLNQRWGLLGAFAAAVVSMPALAETTLWLVRPLYPGQEALVAKTEKALDALIAGDARAASVIGTAALAATLKGRTLEDVPCLSGTARCADPIDPFVAGLGFDRVMLIQGGQDEAGFKFKVASYEPKSGKSTPAAATNTVLEKALLGAIVKVYPAASTLDVRSTPPGATVLIDETRAGTTPLSTQVLPGEHVIRLDLKLHQPLEETVFLPFRGQLTLEKALEKVAARIVISAQPAGASISIDGQVMGKDKVDRGISPGEHVVRLVAEGHKAFEQTIMVKADEQFSLDRALEPIAPVAVAVITQGVPVKDSARPSPPPPPPPLPVLPPPPPAPPDETDRGYERRNYFMVGFASSTLLGDSLVGRRWDVGGVARTETLTTPGRRLLGVEVEFGVHGRHFGVAVFGFTYLTNAETWGITVGRSADSTGPEKFTFGDGPPFLDSVKVGLGQLRALQPEFRVCFWRFQLTVQAGLELRTGQIVGTSKVQTENPYGVGFMPVDLLGTGRVSLRASLADDVFVYGAANYFRYLLGETTFANVRSSSAWGYNLGLGYGF